MTDQNSVHHPITPSRPGSGKVHRHHLPAFCGHIPNMPAAKKFAAALAQHDWNRNPAIFDLRCERNQRISVRSERRQTYDALALAMVAHCDYNPDNEYLFEVMCSVEELARLTGQLHRCDSGRKTYDPVRLAFLDWEAAKLIVIHREFDSYSKQHKAMRIWVRPAFFETLGFNRAELRDIVTKFRRWMERHGQRETQRQRYQQHLLRIARSNVASMDNAHSLKKLLRKIKREVLPTDTVQQDEKQAVLSGIEAQLKQTEAVLAQRPSTTGSERPYFQLYTRWSTQQPRMVTLQLEMAVKQAEPSLSGEAYFRALVERIPQH